MAYKQVDNQNFIQEQRHQFAFGFNDMFKLQEVDSSITLDDAEIVHRVFRVVKLSVNEKFVLFNQSYHAIVELLSVCKKSLTLRVLSHEQNNQLKPKITFLLPLLKRDALEASVYSLAELGVNEIQLVATEKSRKKLTDKEMLRLQKVVVAAAEQSKHYAYPDIRVAESLDQSFKSLYQERDKIVFDVDGQSFFDIRQKFSKDMYLIVGPEGGLTQEELLLLKEHEFITVRLTQTVLRALQAVAVSSSLFRL